MVYPTEYKKTLGPWLVEIAGKPVTNTQYFLFELYNETTNPQIESITIPNNIPYLSDYFISDVYNNVNTINFLGTKLEWEQITTARDYNYIFNYNELLTNIVHCTDGDVCIQHTGGTASCSSKATCTTCGIKYGDIKSHTGGTATCTTKRTCTVCEQQYGSTISYSIVNGKCPMCGLDNNKITFTTSEYVNSIYYKVLGTWEFDNNSTVDITITCNTERNWDYIMLAVGSNYTSGTSPSSSYNFISTSGTIGSCTTTTLSGSKESIFKFTSDPSKVEKTWTLTNVPVPKGSVIVYTDGSVLGAGATVTVTKH